MINQVFGMILMTVSGAIQGWAMEHMIEHKNPKISVKKRMIFWFVLSAIASFLNVFSNNALVTQTFRQILYGGCVLFALKFFYKDPVWRRILAMFLVFFAFTMSEFGMVLAYQFQGIDFELLQDRTNAIAVIFIAIGSLISCISTLIVVILWKKAFQKGNRFEYTWFIIGYAFYQYFSQFIMANSIYDSNINNSEVIVVSVGMICLIVLLFTVFSQVEKQGMRVKLSEESLKNNLEKIHYDEVRNRRNQMQEILSDYKEELLNVKKMLNKKQLKESGYALESMIRRMDKTKEYPYCSIPVVNALISEKQKVCQDNNIDLQVNLKFPEGINVNYIDICCIISNMLDNAIRACEQVTKSEIGLTAVIKKGYLIIKCENPSVKAPELKPEGTGYGLKILKGIAERYSGDFQTTYENHKFTSQIILKV